ncbi:MAG: DUF4190 domain-containing protein [Pirellulaceae bacterium]|nr:DUF4190 domain-containing protein [Planctomycetales bacterium]
MAIELTCGGCRRRLRLADEHAGMRAVCPECNETFTVPSVSEPAHEAIERAIGTSAAEAAEWSMLTPDQQVYGPVVRSQLEQWVREGRVSAACKLKQGEGRWQTASVFFPELDVSRTTVPPRQPHNPFADRDVVSNYQSPGATGYQPRASNVEPHRGVLVLVLSILGWAVFPLFSVAAWILGASDLKQMRRGRMDPSGEGLTRAGVIIAMIQCVLLGFVLFIALIVLVGAFLSSAM